MSGNKASYNYIAASNHSMLFRHIRILLIDLFLFAECENLSFREMYFLLFITYISM